MHVFVMVGLALLLVSCERKRVIHESYENYSYEDFIREKHVGYVYKYYETGELKSIDLYNIDSVFVSSMSFSKAGYLRSTIRLPYYIVLKHDSIKAGDNLSFMVFVITHKKYECVVTFDDEEIEVVEGKYGYSAIFSRILNTPGVYVSELKYRLFYKGEKMSEHVTKLNYVCYE